MGRKPEEKSKLAGERLIIARKIYGSNFKMFNGQHIGLSDMQGSSLNSLYQLHYFLRENHSLFSASSESLAELIA